MKLEHIAIYVKDLEKSKSFYSAYFGGKASEKYVNTAKQFSSYFITFESGSRLEIMHQPHRILLNPSENLGIHHLAFSAGSREKVDEFTEKFRKDGFTIYGEPRITGDGYYESVILDPDGNMLEITE
ncbi:MAG: hypothetical protein HC905_29010 [Bacteroidales bacterium]|nr:hypothetical protein [Bacteroidales bacterium]